MAEPDHIFVSPLPNLAHGDLPAAYPFFYIKPEENEKILRKFFPEENGPVTNIDPIGNSPVIIKKVNMFFHLPVIICFLHSPLLSLTILSIFCNCPGFAGENCTYLDECFFENER